MKSLPGAKGAAAAQASDTGTVDQSQAAPTPASSWVPQRALPQAQPGRAAPQAPDGLRIPGASQDSGAVLHSRPPAGPSPTGTPPGLSPAGTPPIASPATSEGAEYTLLPGYVSRPGPSPIKAAEQQGFQDRSSGQGPGGFLRAPPSKPAARSAHDKGTGASEEPGPAGGSDAEERLWMELAEEAERAAQLLTPAGPPAAPEAGEEEGAAAGGQQARPGRPKRAAAAGASAEPQGALKRARHAARAEPADRLLDPTVKLTAGVRRRPCF